MLPWLVTTSHTHHSTASVILLWWWSSISALLMLIIATMHLLLDLLFRLMHDFLHETHFEYECL